VVFLHVAEPGLRRAGFHLRFVACESRIGWRSDDCRRSRVPGFRSGFLVAEQGASYRSHDDVLEIRRSRGWLRTRYLLLDFRLKFEYRLVTPDTDAGVAIRSWTGNGGWPAKGYRFRLPAPGEPPPVLVGRRAKVAALAPAAGAAADGEWEQVEIAAVRARISLKINGADSGSFDIDDYGGYVIFDVTKGSIQVRNVVIENVDVPVAYSGNPAAVEPVRNKTEGLISAKLVREVRPNYTSEAMSRRVQGTVNMEVVVMPDGTPGPVRIIKSLDPDLDISAIAAVRAWRFTPASYAGKPVPSVVEVEMFFTLK
jgi:TonB family protein